MLAGKRSILIQSPTGSGKTALTAQMLVSAAQKNMRSWFIVHRRELIWQAIRAFSEINVRVGVVSSGFPSNLHLPVQICSIQSLLRRFEKMVPPSLIVWDECHHQGATTWAKIRSHFNQSFHVGLSATPQRLDGQGLDKWYEEIVRGPSVRWLIDNNFLSPYRLFAPPSVNVDKIKTRMGDFAVDDLTKALDKPTITGDAIAHYKKHASEKRAIVFCVSVEHSKHVVQQFIAEGITAVHVDGTTDTNLREKSISDFKSGKISILSNVDLFGEGFDVPAVEVGIFLRPTQSLGLYLQQVGRTLRPFEGKKEAILLDHAGNCARHGFPDEPHEWNLAGIDRRKKEKITPTISVRICPKCFAAQASGIAKCLFCGFTYPVDSRKVNAVEGDLREISAKNAQIVRYKEQSRAFSFEELVAIGRKRGYRRPQLWAKHVLNARQAKFLRQEAQDARNRDFEENTNSSNERGAREDTPISQ